MVCYKSSGLSYAIAKRIVKLEYISLVNLILDKEVVKELIQNDCTTEKIAATLALLGEEKIRQQIELDYNSLTKRLGEKKASQTVAQQIVSSIK